MPYNKQYRRRRRRFYRKYPKGLIHHKPNLRVQFNRLNSFRMYQCLVQSSADLGGLAATGGFSWNVSVNFPTCWRAPGGTFGQMGAFSTHLARLLAYFDLYRVVAIRTCLNSTFTDTTTPIQNADIPNDCYIVNDADDITLLTTDAASMADGMMPRTLFTGKPMYHVMRNPSKMWLNTQLATSATAGNIQFGLPGAVYVQNIAVSTSQVVNPTIAASTKFFIPRLNSNQDPGRIIAVWLIQFKGITYL